MFIYVSLKLAGGKCPAIKTMNPQTMRNMSPWNPEQMHKEFTRLAETRLAQNTLNYITLVSITLTWIKLPWNISEITLNNSLNYLASLFPCILSQPSLSQPSKFLIWQIQDLAGGKYHAIKIMSPQRVIRRGDIIKRTMYLTTEMLVFVMAAYVRQKYADWHIYTLWATTSYAMQCSIWARPHARRRAPSTNMYSYVWLRVVLVLVLWLLLPQVWVVWLLVFYLSDGYRCRYEYQAYCATTYEAHARRGSCNARHAMQRT